MYTPKVNFKNIPISTEIDWFHGFLFQNEWGWSKYILKKHPKIKEIYHLKSEKEQVAFLKKYITDFKKKNKNKKKYQAISKRVVQNRKRFF